METGRWRQSPSRDFRIDCLRGLSILSVLVLHFHLAYNLLKSPLGRLLPGPYLGNLVRNGNYGVIVFFVISGYLITSTSLRRFGSLGAVAVRTFYAFRFARIVPCLLLVLAILSGLAMAGVKIFQDDGGVPLWLANLSVLTFWHNILMARYGYFNYCLNIFWSLSVEEVFYLVFPLLCVVLRRTEWIVLVWVGAVVTGPVYRSLHQHNEILFLYGNLACFDLIAMGCLVALLSRRTQIGSIPRNLLQGLVLLGMTAVFLGAGIDSTPVWGPSLMGLGAAGFLWAEGAGVRNDTRPNLGRTMMEPLAWMGRLSYELYLFHIVLLAGLRSVLDPHGTSPALKPLLLLVFLMLSLATAWCLARWVSEPANKALRRHLSGREPERNGAMI